MPTAIAKPKTYYFCQIPTGLPCVHFEWSFWGKPRSKFGVELHFEKGTREASSTLLRKFEPLKEDIEKVTGEKAIFQENWGSHWSRLYIEKKEGEMTEELKKWAVEKMTLLYNFLQPKIESMK